jgi:hypothetical protein
MAGVRDEDDSAGRQIMRAALDRADVELGGRLLAAFAIGSLAHGGFVPQASDVDLALIVDRVDESARAAIRAAAEEAKRGFAGSAHEELAGRLSIFWSDWEHLARNEEAGRFPAVDRFDLLDSGVLLRGIDRRPECTRPTRLDLFVNSATFAVTRFGDADYQRMIHDPYGLARRGRVAVTKAVLFPVRLLYTAATGRPGRNDDAIAWYVARPRISDVLVTAAARWRAYGLDDSVGDLLHRWLVPLYRDCVERLGGEAANLGRPDLVAKLSSLHRGLSGEG